MQERNETLSKGLLAKIRETAGETLVETLFALVIIVLAFTFFPTAIMAATNIARTSEEAAVSCPEERGDDSAITGGSIKTFITFKAVGSGSTPVGANSDITWVSNSDGTTYTQGLSISGTHLVSDGNSSVSGTVEQSSIEVMCYKNSVQSGSTTTDYYFYDPVEVG